MKSQCLLTTQYMSQINHRGNNETILIKHLCSLNLIIATRDQCYETETENQLPILRLQGCLVGLGGRIFLYEGRLISHSPSIRVRRAQRQDSEEDSRSSIVLRTSFSSGSRPALCGSVEFEVASMGSHLLFLLGAQRQD